MKYQTISIFAAKGRIYYVTIAMVIFSHVKTTCFCAKAHLVFHWCLYNKMFFQFFFFLSLHPNFNGKMLFMELKTLTIVNFNFFLTD